MHIKRFIDHFLGRRDAFGAQAKLEARHPAITIVSVIYSTAPKTFTGEAVYVTQTVPTVQATDISQPDDDASTTILGRTSNAGVGVATRRSSSSSSGSSSSASSTAGSAALTAAASNTSAAPTVSNTSVASAAPASGSNGNGSAGGMSGGAKAGLAFGLIILFALIGAGIFLILKKRKRDAEEGERLDDEKSFFAAGRNPDSLPSHTTANTSNSRVADAGYYSEKPVPPQPAASGSADNRARFSYEETAAPRLSLRGVSQFGSMGNLNDNGPLSAASSQALPAAGAAALAAAGGLGAALATRDRSNTVNNNDPNNPFGNHAEKLDNTATLAPRPRSAGPQAADFPLPDSAPNSPKVSPPVSPELAQAQVAEGSTAAAAATTAAGAAAIAAATAAAASNTPQGGPVAENVYRVQLDFKPSMDDELDISAGQLVRVLHEYDDGWALCIRMDRSKQGVVPRTCLSKHAVKPRPASPNGRPGPRGPPPPGMRGPPGFGQPRPHSPASGRNSPGPFSGGSRPLTPTQNGRERAGSNAPYAQHPGMRAASPGPNGGSRLRHQEGSPQQRNRSESNAQSGLRNGQTPSQIPAPVVSRKPVGSS